MLRRDLNFLYQNPKVENYWRPQRSRILRQALPQGFPPKLSSYTHCVSQNFRKRLLASSRLSVHLSAWKNSLPAWRISIEFDIRAFFRKSAKKIQVSLKSDKNNGHFKWRSMYIYYKVSPNEKRFRQMCTENQNTYFIFNKRFPKIVPCMTKRGKIRKSGRPQMTI
jgi:hypothetical protein